MTQILTVGLRYISVTAVSVQCKKIKMHRHCSASAVSFQKISVARSSQLRNRHCIKALPDLALFHKIYFKFVAFVDNF